MLRFLAFLQEELNRAQKNTVDSWHRGDYSFSDHVFGGPSDGYSWHHDHVVVPMDEPPPPAEPHPEVKQHLEKHGYQISDYRTGLVKKADGSDTREHKLGKILNQTNATPEVQKAFANDPQRKASTYKPSGLQVVVTRHKYDVAGMSTNQGWSSCQALMPNGKPKDPANNRLQGDIRAGTHVAYLTKSGDNRAENPIARIALRAYRSDSGHKIIRPSNKTYGDANDNFHSVCKKFCEDHFPAVDLEYSHAGGYIDPGDNETLMPSHISDEEAHRYLDTGSYSNASVLSRHPSISSNVIDRLLDHENETIRNAAATHPNASPENQEKAYRKGHLLELFRNPNMHESIIKKAFRDGRHLAIAINNHDFSDYRTKSLKKLLDSSDTFATKRALSDAQYVAGAIAGRDYSTPEQIKLAYQLSKKEREINPDSEAKIEDNRYFTDPYKKIIKHSNTPSDVLRELYHHTVVKNPVDMLNRESAGRELGWRTEDITRNRNTPSDVLEHIYKNYAIHMPTSESVGNILRHDNCPKQLLRDVLQGKQPKELDNMTVGNACVNRNANKKDVITALKRLPTLMSYYWDYGHNKKFANGQLTPDDVAELTNHFTANNPDMSGYQTQNAIAGLIRSSDSPHDAFVYHDNPLIRHAAYHHMFTRELTRKHIRDGLKDVHNVAAEAKNRKKSVYEMTRNE